MLDTKKLLAFLALVFLTIGFSAYAGLTTVQLVAVTITLSFIYGTLLFWKMRLAFAFLGISALFLFGVLDLAHFIAFASLDIIMFLVGMMIIVAFLEKNHLFEYVMSKILPIVGADGKRVTLALLILAAVFAALVDEVTSILFMMSIILHMTGKLNVNPIPFVLMVIFATNIGSSATVVGNPVGVLVALKGGFTFADFLRWATPISAVALLASILVSFWFFRREIAAFGEAIQKAKGGFLEKVHGHDVFMSGTLFAGVLTSLILHGPIEVFLGLEKNILLLTTALAGGAIVLFLEGENARQLVETRVDWWTLTFFMLLFASVGALKYVGVTDLLAHALISFSGTDPTATLGVVLVSAGILSALLDNVLAVAVFIPILEALGPMGVESAHLWWALLFGGTLFGNLTVIGSTANIIAVGMLERRKIGHVSFRDWIVPGFLVVLPTAIVAFIMLFFQLPLLLNGS